MYDGYVHGVHSLHTYLDTISDPPDTQRGTIMQCFDSVIEDNSSLSLKYSLPAGGGAETDAFKHLAAAFTVLRSLGSAKTAANRESSRIVSYATIKHEDFLDFCAREVLYSGRIKT